MPSTTTRGFRYPLDSDPVSDGAAAVRNLADDVNSKVGAIARGTSTVTVTASTIGTAAVSFPAGRFTAAPAVVATGNNSSVWMAYVQAVTKDRFTLGVRQVQGTSTSATVSVHWIAVEQ